MFKSIAGLILSTAIVALASTLCAGTLSVEPGLWKTAITTVRNGQTLPTHTNTRCYTQGDIDEMVKSITDSRIRQNPNCKESDVSETKNSLRWKFECSGQFQMVAEGKVKFDGPRHFTGEMTGKGNVMGNEIDNDSKMEGERVGACSK